MNHCPKCVGYDDGGCDGGFMEEHQDNCPMKGHPEVSLDITWEAAFEAGRSAGEQELRAFILRQATVLTVSGRCKICMKQRFIFEDSEACRMCESLAVLREEQATAPKEARDAR